VLPLISVNLTALNVILRSRLKWKKIIYTQFIIRNNMSNVLKSRVELCIRITNFIIVVFILTCSVFPGNVRASEDIDILIEEGKVFRKTIWIGTESTFNYDVSVESGGDIDVYIMNSTEYKKYIQNETFYPHSQYEIVRIIKGAFEVRDDGTYYLIVDNWNHRNDGDASPIGDVNVNISLEYEKISDEKPLINAYIICGSVFIILLIFGVGIGEIFIRRWAPIK